MVTLTDLYDIRRKILIIQEIVEDASYKYSENTEAFKAFNQIYAISIKLYDKAQSKISELIADEIITQNGGAIK